jgi:hypothetical protein
LQARSSFQCLAASVEVGEGIFCLDPEHRLLHLLLPPRLPGLREKLEAVDGKRPLDQAIARRQEL